MANLCTVIDEGEFELSPFKWMHLAIVVAVCLIESLVGNMLGIFVVQTRVSVVSGRRIKHNEPR